MAIRRTMQNGMEQDPEVTGGPFQSMRGPGQTTTPPPGDGPFVDRTNPAPRDPDQSEMFGGGEGQSQETPRERAATPTSTMRKPSSPQPMAGSSFSIGDMMGPIPFKPMGGAGMAGGMSGGMGRGLFGKLGGLQGGGLGVPQDATSDAQSDPISTLIQLLMRGKGGL